MQTKSKFAFILGLVLFGTIAWMAFGTSKGPTEEPSLQPPSDVAVRDAMPRDANPVRLDGEHDSARTPAGTPRDGKPTEQSELASENAPQVPTPPPGQLTLSVVDAANGHDLQDVSVRGLSASRFFQESASSPLELTLSPGTYELLVLAPGFDPLVLDPLELSPNENRHVGPLSMYRGTARLEVKLEAPPTLGQGKYRLELFGAGRNACARHDPTALPCPHCGFAPDRTTGHVVPGGTRDFDELAAGDYRLILYEPNGTALVQDTVQVEAGQRKEHTVRVEFADLLLALRDARDQPFVGAWVEEGEEFLAPVNFYLLDDDTCLAVARWKPPGLVPKTTVEDEVPPTRVVSGRGQGTETRQVRPGTEGPQHDEARRTGHSLWPEILTPAPRVDGSPVDLERIPPELVRLAEVSTSASGVLVQCGPFFESVAIDFNTWDGEPIPVKLESRCGMSSKLLMGQAKCNACHAVPAGVFD